MKKGNIKFAKLVVDTKDEYLNALKDFSPDIILSDHSLPSFNSTEALKIIKETKLDIPFILVTSTMSEEYVVGMMQFGISDYVLKDRLTRLPNAVINAIERNNAKKESKKFLDQLVANAALMKEVQQLAHLGSVDVDLETNIMNWSDEIYNIFGYKIGEVEPSYENILKCVHPDDLEEFKRSTRYSTKHLDYIHREYRVKMKDGSIKYIDSALHFKRNESKMAIRIKGFNQDITIRKKAEEEIKNSELRFREFFETAPEAICVYDPGSGFFIDFNDNALKLLKCSADEMLKKHPINISPRVQPDGMKSQDKAMKFVSDTMKGEKPVFDWVILDSTGSEIFCEIRLNLLHNGAGPMIRLSVIDITNRVMLERKLVDEKIKNQKEITDAVITAQEKERSFLGEELHDNINQILAASKLYLDTALSSDHLQKDIIKDSRGFLINAMEEIRKLSKSLLPPSLGGTSLVDTLNELIGTIQHASNLNFIKEFEGINESLFDERLSVAIFRIVQEQLNNILKHASATTVIIELKQDDRILQLRIKDDGIGFDTSEKRTGIGLKNIVSRIELFKGTQVINSRPGEGCELAVNFNVE